MKTTLLIITLAFCLSSYAQTSTNINKPVLTKAVLPECYDSTDPTDCTQQKLEIDISNLITYDISKDIEKDLKEKYFSISVIFVTDENGKVIPQETDVFCKNILFKNAIENYIKALPVFLPNNNNDTERRTLHTIYQTYMFDYVIKKYYAATKERLVLEKISPEYVLYDTPALYPGCKCKNKFEKSNACTVKKMIKFVNKNFEIPLLPNDPRTVEIIASIVVEKDGTITIQKIYKGEDLLNAEMERVIKTFPLFSPVKLKGFPFPTKYNFPVKITYHK